LQNVPKRAWRPRGGLADRVAGRLFHYRRGSCRLQFFAKGGSLLCGRCGTPLTWQAIDNPLLIDVSISSLDDPASVEPSLHIWTESRIAWFDTADRLPRYPTNERPKSAS
jgi:hypothetical protein